MRLNKRALTLGDTTTFENTFDNYIVDMYNRNAYRVAKEFISTQRKKEKELAIFGLTETGKTRLLQAVANYCRVQNSEIVMYISKEELIQELNQAKAKKDIFLTKLKRKFRKAHTVCMDEVDKALSDNEIQALFIRWLNYCRRHFKRIIYTYDCDEVIYCVFEPISKLNRKTMAVGIPKPGQNRNLEVIKIME